ncbi:MAG: zinc-ribbon domain-containing protein [Eubacterium sp.]|nr:zinc-ribbon domain-containing protein [Eubacterium sp.]
MIKCPECEKEISDKAKKCIHCGMVLPEEQKKYCSDCGKEISIDAAECPYCGCPVKRSHKLNLKILVIIILIIIAFTILIAKMSSSKSLSEKSIENCYKKLQSILLAPDSIIIYDCFCKDYTLDENYNSESDVDEYGDPRKDVMVYIHFGSTNKIGGITESSYIFACDEKGKVIEYMDMDDCKENAESGNLSALLSSYWLDAEFAESFGWSEAYINYSPDEVEKLIK